MEDCRDRILSALFRMIYLCQRQFIHVSSTLDSIDQECNELQQLLQQCRTYYDGTNDLAYVSRAYSIRVKLQDYYITYALYKEEYQLLPDFINKLASPLLGLLDPSTDYKELSAAGLSVGNRANTLCHFIRIMTITNHFLSFFHSFCNYE